VRDEQMKALKEKEAAYYGETTSPATYPTAQAVGAARGIGSPVTTLREQAEKNAYYHREEAQKHSSAAAFLSEYPQFDEFIRLVRSGAIQL
jgi:hypothetical protein